MPNELDELSDRLFSAARRERPRDQARTRALASALASASEKPLRLRKVFAIVALAAGFGVLVAYANRRAPLATIDRESPAVPAHERVVNPPTPEPARETEPGPAPSAKAPDRPTSSARPAASLSAELELLESARAALAEGANQRALELVERYHSTLQGKHLRAEAALLRIQALAATGRKDEAARLARVFVEENAGSPLVDRARSYAAETSSENLEESTGRTP
jgi:hypothetical protein